MIIECESQPKPYRTVLNQLSYNGLPNVSQQMYNSPTNFPGTNSIKSTGPIYFRSIQ